MVPLKVLSIVSCFGGTAYAQSQQPLGNVEPAKPWLSDDFDSFVHSTIDKHHVPGLSLAIIDGDSVFSRGYGFASLPDVRATADTQYFTGSTTKAFTAAITALLIHNKTHYHDLHWKTRISDIIPADFVLEDEYASTHLTFEDALSHRTGLPRHDLMYGGPGETPSSVAKRMKFLPLTAEPRTTYQYCNIMFGVMTEVVETLTGKPLERLLDELIWKPLGMLSTTFTLPTSEENKSRLARGYFWTGTDGVAKNASQKSFYVAEPYIDISCISGAGSTISTVNDYALWIKAFLHESNHGITHNTSSPITRQVFRDLVSPRTITMTGPYMGLYPHEKHPNKFIESSLYSLGWSTTKALNLTLIGHNGGLTGFGTEVYFVPGYNFGIVTMGNTAGTSNDAGAAIAARVVLDKFGPSESNGEDYISLQSTLSSLTPRTVPSMKSPKLESEQTTEDASPSTPHPEVEPIPLKLSQFAGLYTNAAYGTYNLTLETVHSQPVLRTYLYPRLWPRKIELEHLTQTVFAAEQYSPHGLAHITSDEVVWERIGTTEAAFSLTGDGKGVARLGIELEDEMIRVAKEKGAEYWKESMIWFERDD